MLTNRALFNTQRQAAGPVEGWIARVTSDKGDTLQLEFSNPSGVLLYAELSKTKLLDVRPKYFDDDVRSARPSQKYGIRAAVVGHDESPETDTEPMRLVKVKDPESGMVVVVSIPERLLKNDPDKAADEAATAAVRALNRSAIGARPKQDMSAIQDKLLQQFTMGAGYYGSK
jgi:hypothetical protein